MLALLLVLLAPGKVDPGAYTLTALCTQLKEASGVRHYVSPARVDYPVFVSVKSGDPARVRALVAAAMHGEWKKDDTGYTLRAVAPEKGEDFAEFERQLKETAKGPHSVADLPAKDLYNMVPGEIVRYGDKPSKWVHLLPEALKDLEGNSIESVKQAQRDDEPGGRVAEQKAPPRVSVLRWSSGMFQSRGLMGGQEVMFSALPKEVRDVLGKDLGKSVISSEDRQKLSLLMKDLRSTRFEFSNLAKEDPVAKIAGMVLPQLGAAAPCDLVLALPDYALFCLPATAVQEGTTGTILAACSTFLNWKVVDGAVVGCLTCCEMTTPTQAKRSAVQRFVRAVGENGVLSAGTMSAYVASQTPYSSNSWTDIMLLMFAGMAMDDEFIGDYPFNYRLYGNLTASDWTALNSGEPFAASTLSLAAQGQLLTLLLHSRSRLESYGQSESDPGWWPSLDMRDLIVQAAIEEQKVLVSWAGEAATVGTAALAARTYDSVKRQLGREPQYQGAFRRRLRITITSRVNRQSVSTGFSEVNPDPGSKPGPWQSLPADLAKAFEDRDKAKPPTRDDQIGG